VIRPSGSAIDLDRASAAAQRVAHAAGTEIRMLDDIDDFVQASRLLDEIWGPSTTTQQMPVEHLRALRHAGNYAAGAFVGEEMVAASVGFFGHPDVRRLHSHITGVSDRARGRGTGYAMKLHQRVWALDLAVRTITWTFDPLVRRNAHFNLAKLGAVPAAYYVDFYGYVDDQINLGQGSDRLLAVWDLESASVRAALGEGDPFEAPGVRPLDGSVGLRAVAATEDGPIVAPRRLRESATAVVVETPRDIEGLRHSAPETAFAWRLAVREVLGELLDAGARFIGLSATGSYHFERNPL
jgi:predicted GNAT superfamily acetyltransferase